MNIALLPDLVTFELGHQLNTIGVMKTYKHLSFEERFVIEKLWAGGSLIRDIASYLGRSPNTISREIQKNMVKGIYDAKKAQLKVNQRRWRAKQQCLKVAMDSFLIQFVESKLELKWSPNQISGYLRTELDMSCSAKAIYKFVESRGLERHLFWRWNKKRGGPKRKTHTPVSDGRKSIDLRPDTSGVFGHYEMDFIVSKHSTWVFLVLVDILTKYTRILCLPNRKRHTIRAAFSELFSGISVKSITTDNDFAFNHWVELEEIIQAPIYFCHPYHSWEKGLVENTNRWIRCFVPKRRDIGSVTHEEIEEILSFINDRPRECVGFWSPREYYYRESVLLEG
jgi:transposase, IS30 family